MKLTKTSNFWQPERYFWKLDQGSARDFDIEIHGDVVAYWRIKYCPEYVECARSRIELGKITARSDNTIAFEKITKKEAEMILNQKTKS